MRDIAEGTTAVGMTEIDFNNSVYVTKSLDRCLYLRSSDVTRVACKMLFVECTGTPYEVSPTRDVITALSHAETRQRPKILPLVFALEPDESHVN